LVSGRGRLPLCGSRAACEPSTGRTLTGDPSPWQFERVCRSGYIFRGGYCMLRGTCGYIAGRSPFDFTQVRNPGGWCRVLGSSSLSRPPACSGAVLIEQRMIPPAWHFTFGQHPVLDGRCGLFRAFRDSPRTGPICCEHLVVVGPYQSGSYPKHFPDISVKATKPFRLIRRRRRRCVWPSRQCPFQAKDGRSGCD